MSLTNNSIIHQLLYSSIKSIIRSFIPYQLLDFISLNYLAFVFKLFHQTLQCFLKIIVIKVINWVLLLITVVMIIAIRATIIVVSIVVVRVIIIVLLMMAVINHRLLLNWSSFWDIVIHSKFSWLQYTFLSDAMWNENWQKVICDFIEFINALDMCTYYRLFFFKNSNITINLSISKLLILEIFQSNRCLVFSFVIK